MIQIRKRLAQAGSLLLILFLLTVSATFAADSGEIKINADVDGHNYREAPAIGMYGNGNIIVAWANSDNDYPEYDKIYFRRGTISEISGNITLGEATKVAGYLTSVQGQVDLAVNDSGAFIVAWTMNQVDGNDQSVHARRYNSDGTPLDDAPFRVNETTAGSQRLPAVAIDDAGNAIVVWAQGDTYSTPAKGIYARRYDRDGTTSPEFRITPADGAYYGPPDASMAADGRAVAVWASEDSTREPSDYLSAQLFNSDGSTSGGVMTLGTHSYYLAYPAVAMNDGGAFTVAWEEKGSVSGILARQFDGAGYPLTNELQIPTALGRWPDVAMDGPLDGTGAAGNFAVTWQASSRDGTSNGVFAQLYEHTGVAEGSAFRVNVRTDENEEFPAVAMTDSDHYVFAWSRKLLPNGSTDGVYARSLDGRPANIAPAVYAGNYDSSFDILYEGETYALSAATASDPEGDPLTYEWTVDNTEVCSFSDSTVLNPTITCTDDGTFTVSLTVSDGTETNTSDSSLRVHNVAPDITITGDSTVAAGETYTLTLGEVIDPGDDSYSAIRVRWADGTTPTYSDTGDVTHVYDEAGDFIIRVDITDEDGTFTNRASLSLSVTPANTAPTITDDSFTTDEDTALIVDAPGLLGNDSDAEGDPLTVALETDPSHGTLTVNEDGSFAYIPVADYYGPDSFTYTANDGDLTSGVATVAIDVVSINDPPVAVDDTATTEQTIPVSIDVAINDSDVDGNLDVASLSISGGPVHGTVDNHGDGTVTYTPDAAYNGVDSFIYRICDTETLCAEATVAITINATNSAPVATDDTYTVDEDKVLEVVAPGVLGNDTDDYDPLVPTLLEDVEYGTLTLVDDGSFTYIPAPDYNGADSFSYEVCDSVGLCDMATVALTISSVNDAPVVNAGGPYIANEGSEIGLYGSSSDVDGDALSYSWSSDGPCTFSDAGVLNPTLTCADNGDFNATLAVNDGASSSSHTASVSVANVAPSAEFAASATTIDEGGSVSLAFANQFDPSSADADSGFAYSYDCDGDGVFEASASLDATYSCSYGDNGVFSARGRIEDKDGDYSDYMASITVDNVAPTIDLIEAPTDPVALDAQPVSIQIFFSDPGADGHTTVIEWGDGAGDTLDGPGPISASHRYGEAGVYSLNISVTDDDGGAASASYEYVVIYNPDGGFVTGRGRIYSEVGACHKLDGPSIPDALSDVCNGATGDARFGFVSRYNRGAELPTGRTDFVFRAGNLRFKSISYNWLVVNQGGANAQFRGEGLINGDLYPEGTGYQFMIWASDATASGADTFRIKIWYEDAGTEHVVYDNGFDQPINDGQIKVQAN